MTLQPAWEARWVCDLAVPEHVPLWHWARALVLQMLSALLPDLPSLPVLPVEETEREVWTQAFLPRFCTMCCTVRLHMLEVGK